MKTKTFEDFHWLFNPQKKSSASRNISRCNLEEARMLWGYAKNSKKGIIEIGTCHGGTTLLLSFASPDVVVTTLDLRNVVNDEVRKELHKRGVEIQNGNSFTFKYEHIYDFAFIDGDHSYEGVKKDFENVISNLEKGSIVCFHDAVKGGYGTCEGVERFCNEILESKAIEFVDSVDSLLVAKLN